MYRTVGKLLGGEIRYSQEPDKNQYSHIADALQYLCLGADLETPDHSARKKEIERIYAEQEHSWTDFGV